MKISHCVFAIAAILGLAASSATAALILPSTYSGPGGTGIDGVAGGNLIEPHLFFSSVDYIDVIMTVDSSGTYNFNEAPAFGSAFNNTGQTWTGFSLQMVGGGVGTFVQSPSVWADYPGFSPANVTATSVLFPTESVLSATSFAFTGYFTASGPGMVTIRETPLVAPVPEPASCAVGLALLAVAVVGRRQTRARRLAS